MSTDADIRRALADQIQAATDGVKLNAQVRTIMLDLATARVKEGKCVLFAKHSEKHVVMIVKPAVRVATAARPAT